MNAHELKRAYLEAQKTFYSYRWEIAKKRGIVQFNILDRSKFFTNDDWDKVASEEEQKQATIFDNEMRKAWRAYQEALREKERIVRK